MNARNTVFKGLKGLTLTGSLIVLAACGGGGGGSSSGATSSSSPVVARGAITQLGSIYVNGVKYETPDGGSYSDDDSSSGVANYQVGQVVSIRGTRNGATGTASEVEYEAEIEGAADVNGQILGVTIVQTPNTNNIAPGSPDPLTNGTRYEISGVWINNKTLEATFIKQDDDGGTGDGIDEIKGFVESVNLGAGSFVVRGITFNGYGGSPVLAPNDYVEVHFNNCSGDPLNCDLTGDGVQLEDDFFDQAEGLEVEVEGAVDLAPSNCPPAADIKVDGVCVDSSTAQWMDGLADRDSLVSGSRVEAEGHMIDASPADYMRADKIKGRGNRVRVTSIATNANIGAGTFDLIEGNINVSTMSGVTQFEDGLTIDTVEAAASVEVRGVRTGPNSLLALRIKDDGGLSSGDRHELRAEVDSVTVVQNNDSSDDRLTVMGIVSQADSGTDLEIGDMVIADSDTNPATPQAIEDFLLTIDADNNPANGPRDVVEIGVAIDTGDGDDVSPYTADSWEVEEEDD